MGEYIHVCIIDDGIDVNMYKIEKLLNDYSICEDLSYIPNNDKIKVNSHGTICAAIIKKYCSKVKFSSIKILDDNLQCSIMKLKAALEASLKIMPDIINLSLGTSNIYEKDLLDPIVDDIVKEGIIVIASYNNQNTFTYPAAHKDVFGVISDKTGKIASGEFEKVNRIFDEIWITNCNIKLYDDMYGIYNVKSCNSFSTAVFTSIVCNEILKGNIYSFYHNEKRKVSTYANKNTYIIVNDNSKMLYSHIIDSKNCVINKENLFFLSKLMNEAILRKIINDRALCKEIIYISEKEVNFFPDHMFFLKYLCDKYFNIYVYYNVGKLENLFLKDESNNIIVYQEKNTNENVVINRIRNIVTINISYNIHHVFDLLCYVTYKLKELELNTEIISNHASSVFYKIRYIEKKRICEDIFYKYLSYYDLDYFIFINCLENKSEQTVKFDKLNPDNNVEINFSRDSIVVTLNCNLKITYNINLSKYKGELELISKIILGIFLSLL